MQHLRKNFLCCRLEAAYCGCLPVVPNALVYPEIYPKSCLYSDENELYEILKDYCETPAKVIEQAKNLCIDFRKYSAEFLLKDYVNIFNT